MSMNGVDISSHQGGMDCGKTKADFFIVKATQGTTYVNPYFSRHYSQAVASGKLVGAYHYASGGDAAKEADYFLSIVGHRVGKCILALDWEHIKGGGENPVFNTSREVSWCQAFAQRIHDKTGVWPFMYMSASVTRRRDWSAVAKNCPLWLAQYGSNDLTGYQSEPWTDGRQLGAWGRKIPIHQYSPSGSISGYRCSRPHGLDLDIAYITPEQWKKYAGGTAIPEPAKEFSDRTDSDLAVEILWELHGNGDDRRRKLGSRYAGAQNLVEFYLENAGELLAAEKAYGKKFGGDLFAGKMRA